ncbi:MAG: TonB-dependent receptor [Thermoanaerobaculia bacterium]|nr:TonB-dependent receptor [Thermoanaerobaculia bacterium]
MRSVLSFSLGVLAVLALLSFPAQLGAQSTGGQLYGKVVDESSAALPGVTVTARNASTGLERFQVSDEQGRYRFQLLPAGTYEVKAELEGFGTVQLTDVAIQVGSSRQLDFALKIAAVEEIITVADVAPLVRTTPAGGTVISQEELETLPLNGRQFANLGTLAAGTTLSYNPDPTKPGQQTIAINGGIGRNVNFLVDGGDNMDDTIGGALQNFSIEGVQEFNILTQLYKAEYGRSTGGVLSVVTKSGTNNFDGSVFGFFRDDSLNSKTESEKQAGVDKQPFSRDQYGASVGGPIVRDKAHFFGTYEKTKVDRLTVTDTDGIFPQLDGQETGTPFDDELYTVKLTWDVNAKNLLRVRYAKQENNDKYNAVPNATPDSYGTLTNKNKSTLVGFTSQIGARGLNEVIVQYSDFVNTITADSLNPASYFPNGVLTGQNPNTPQSTTQDKRQFKDEFSWTQDIAGDSHDFKVGVEYLDEPDLGGDFSSGTNGTFSRSENRADSPVTAITFTSGSFNFSTPNTQYRFFAQDDWQVNSKLTVNLGVRYEYSDVLELDQRSNAIWQTLSSLPSSFYDETPYLEPFRNGGGGIIEADDDDIAPRVGFSYDLKGDGKQILRGGWGVYYDFPYTNATVLFPAAAVFSLFGTTYNHVDPAGIRNPDGSFFQPGDPAAAPTRLPGTSLEPAPNEIASPRLQTPYSTQASLGYSQQLTTNIGLNVDVVTIRYQHIPYRVRANPRVDTTGDGVPDARRFSDFGNFRLWDGDGFASYDALNVGLRGRASAKFEFQAFYTLSKAEGNVLAGADEFRLTDTGHQPDLTRARDVSINPLNPTCDACSGPLNTDARHRVTLSGIYHGPWGLTFSGIFRYRSALPILVHSGLDLNGDSFFLDPEGNDGIGAERGSSFSQLDLRLSKEFNFGDDFSLEIIAEVFNVFNDDNPAGYNGARFAGTTTDANGNTVRIPNTSFLQPSTYAGDQLQGEQRLAQLGLRLRF